MSVPKSFVTDSQRECSRRSFLATTSLTAGAALLVGSDKSACIARAAQEARGHLFFESATTLAAMIRTKEVSSAEVVQSFLDRIAEVDPKIRAVLYLAGKQALMRAREADVALAKGTIWGPLHGVPVSIKDNLDTAGIPTTCGVPLWRNRIAKEDATVVRKVKAAGAIVLAKTNLPFCGGAYESQNLFCKTNNPYDCARTPGGSSGGEAALIASGGSPMGIGVDTGGSIRVPSHFCGIAGLRPAHGRVSLTGFLPEQDGPGPVWYTTAGPMARYVEDLALMLPIILGPDSQDPFTYWLDLKDHRKVDPGKLRIGWWTGDDHIEASKETHATVENAARALDDLGANVTKIDAPYDLKRADDILVAVFADSIINDMPRELKRLGAGSDKFMLEGVEVLRESFSKLPADEIESLKSELRLLRRSVYASMQGHDAVLCPVTRNPAAKHGTTWRKDADLEFCYCQVIGLVWTLPTGVVRCGTSEEGLPIGVQVVGAPHREDIVLAILSRLEKQLRGWKPPTF